MQDTRQFFVVKSHDGGAKPADADFAARNEFVVWAEVLDKFIQLQVTYKGAPETKFAP